MTNTYKDVSSAPTYNGYDLFLVNDDDLKSTIKDILSDRFKKIVNAYMKFCYELTFDDFILGCKLTRYKYNNLVKIVEG
jgi:hypothetical protein